MARSKLSVVGQVWAFMKVRKNSARTHSYLNGAPRPAHRHGPRLRSGSFHLYALLRTQGS